MRLSTLPLALALAAAPLAADSPRPLPRPGSVAVAGPEGAPADPLAGLLTLPGRSVDVRYSGDSLDRAARLQSRLEALHGLWQPLTRRPLVLEGVAVTREDWERLQIARRVALRGDGSAAPWGLPVELGAGRFAVPARGDAESVAALVERFGRPLPDPGGEPLVGTREEAGSLIAGEVLLQVAAARRFVAVAGLEGDEPWIAAVLAHLAARYAWESVEPDRVLEVVALLDRLTLLHGGPRAHRLAGYRGALPEAQELWYEAQFVRGADAIWIVEGRRGTARRLERWAQRGKALERADLERAYPALLDWRSASFAP